MSTRLFWTLPLTEAMPRLHIFIPTLYESSYYPIIFFDQILIRLFRNSSYLFKYFWELLLVKMPSIFKHPKLCTRQKR